MRRPRAEAYIRLFALPFEQPHGLRVVFRAMTVVLMMALKFSGVQLSLAFRKQLSLCLLRAAAALICGLYFGR